jgi:hypothetical protein
MLVHRRLASLLSGTHLLLDEDKQVGLGVLLRDTWKEYGFWQDLNP